MDNRVIDDTRLAEEMLTNKYDYIFVGITPWHCYGAHSFINKNLCKDKVIEQLEGLIIILPHPQTGYCVKEEWLRSFFGENAKIIFGEHSINLLRVLPILKGIKKIRIYRKSKISDTYLISAAIPMIYSELALFRSEMKKNHLIVVDEGVSGYLSPWGWMRHSLYEEHNIKNAIKVFLRHTLANALGDIFDVRIQYWTLYKKNKKLLLDKYVADAYLDSFKSSNNKQSIDLHIGRPYILFISQPVLSIQEEKENIEIINLLIEKAQKFQYSFVIKIHPRDDIQKWKKTFKCDIINNNAAIEFLYESLEQKPALVIGYRSTALLSLHAFFDCKCISILPFIKEIFRRDYCYDERFFVDNFRNEIKMISTIDEYSDYLLDMVNN